LGRLGFGLPALNDAAPLRGILQSRPAQNVVSPARPKVTAGEPERLDVTY
jgi:hypothetical protein